MTQNLEHLDSLIEQLTKLEGLRDEAYNSMSKIDGELSDWYHRVEGLKITHVSQSHELIKQVKIILEKRRVIKLEANVLRMVCDNLNGLNIKTKYDSIVDKHEKLIIDLTNNAKI
jgi:hypothetical protein